MARTLDIDQILRDARVGITPEEFDALPFGAIRLDRNGTVVAYNTAEANLAHRDAARTIGRNFFTEVAPCTDTDLFHGTLDRLAARGGTTARINYRFKFPWGDRDVRIQFWLPAPNDRWIFVLPLD